MADGLSGDFRELEQLATSLGRAGSEVIPRIIEISEPQIAALVAAQLQGGESPYGETWPENADGTQPLLDMRASARVRKTKRGGIAVRIGRRVAFYHQQGNDHLPQRELLPTDEQGIPPEWEAIFNAAVDQVEGELRGEMGAE